MRKLCWSYPVDNRVHWEPICEINCQLPTHVRQHPEIYQRLSPNCKYRVRGRGRDHEVHISYDKAGVKTMRLMLRGCKMTAKYKFIEDEIKQVWPPSLPPRKKKHIPVEQLEKILLTD